MYILVLLILKRFYTLAHLIYEHGPLKNRLLKEGSLGDQKWVGYGVSPMSPFFGMFVSKSGRTVHLHLPIN